MQDWITILTDPYHTSSEHCPEAPEDSQSRAPRSTRAGSMRPPYSVRLGFGPTPMIDTTS